MSDEWIEQLEPFRDRLSELLERGLQQLQGDSTASKTIPTLESLRDRRDELLAIFDKTEPMMSRYLELWHGVKPLWIAA